MIIIKYTKIVCLSFKLNSNLGRSQILIDCEVGSFALPHPYKTRSNVSSSRRQYGAAELSNDLSLCEDAHFTLSLPSEKNGLNQVYLCVADGSIQIYFFFLLL